MGLKILFNQNQSINEDIENLRGMGYSRNPHFSTSDIIPNDIINSFMLTDFMGLHIFFFIEIRELIKFLKFL